MPTELDLCAYEVRQLLHAQPYIITVQRTVFGVIKQITDVNLKNSEAKEEIWW